MVIWYKNSFLASLVSILGSVMALSSIAMIMEGGENAGAGIAMMVAGVAMIIWGKKISKNKAFKKWWKQIEDNNLEDAVKTDLNTAITIYKKNPTKRTIQEIAKLNPQFATYITQNVAKKK